jgi:hypothetical protein
VLFSAIIPTFNRLPLLKEALDSIWNQTCRDFEVIVVDDGSTDQTLEYLSSLGNMVTTLVQENEGPGAARNAGAKVAKGKFIAFLDSDDLWFPWTLATYVKCIGLHPQINMLGGCAVHFEAPAQLPRVEFPLRATLHKCLFEAAPGGDLALPTPAVAFRRESFLKMGGFRELYIGEDMDLWLRAGCLENFVRIESPELCAERRHIARITRNLRPALDGINHALKEESSGNYPGGSHYAGVRCARLARAARSISVACLGQGLAGAAWRLYFRTLRINLGLGRWRYLSGFPLRAVTSAIKSRNSDSANTFAARN